MSLPPITRQEFDELREQLRLRKSTWRGRENLWIRCHRNVNQLAIKASNGLPGDMYQIDVAVIPGFELSLEEAERYVEWLLRKFTSYGERLRIVGYLRNLDAMYHVDESELQQIARDITEIEEPRDVLLSERTAVGDVECAAGVDNLETEIPPVSPQSTVADEQPDRRGAESSTPPAARRVLSRYLRYLLDEADKRERDQQRRS